MILHRLERADADDQAPLASATSADLGNALEIKSAGGHPDPAWIDTQANQVVAGAAAQSDAGVDVTQGHPGKALMAF
ncbi:hypothetical protein GCM10020216_092350 [Nonomuraea helvata]